MVASKYLSKEALEQGLDFLRQSPKDIAKLDLIVRRPAENEREVLQEAQLDVKLGLVGDTWHLRSSSRSSDGSPHPDMQLNLMNSRVIDLLTSGNRARWQLAGDQFFLDMDLSKENLPAGTQLVIGEAVIEVTAQPHTGCDKFVERFGLEAMKFVNSKVGKALCLRGINAKLVKPGVIRTGDTVTKLA
ncbi:MAG: hypothetical protein KC422_02305 [Trueperaceae bacterium]|nr:hypothetical protein [Trueperaceae bacterium]